jgi:cytidylate kinase
MHLDFRNRADAKGVRVPIITISRGSFSGGKMVAEAVAEKLGYRCIDRDQIIQKAEMWGVSQDELRAAIEKPPTFLGQSFQTKYVYLAFIQAALTEEVRSGNAIYHGLAGHLLLGKGRHVLRIRLVAAMEFRIEQVQNLLRCNRKEAIAYIEKADQDRRKWTKFLYDVDWTDASLYDVVLNLEQISLQEACDVICSVSQLNCFEFTPDCRRAMDDLALASWVRAKLAMDPATANFQFDVVAEGGAVSVKGAIISPAQAQQIDDIVRSVPDVASVELRQLKLVSHI